MTQSKAHQAAIHISGTPCTMEEARALAMQAYSHGDFAAAADIFERIIALEPDAIATHYNLGSAFQQMQRYEEALESYGRALSLKPDYFMAHNNRGIIFHEMRRYPQALGSYDRAIALKSDYGLAYNNRGLTLQALARYAGALENYDRAIALAPDFADAHYNRGNALHKLNRHDEALGSYDRAIASQPGYGVAFNNKGNVLYELGRYGEALESYGQALALDPGIPCLLGSWLHTGMQLCDWRELDAAFDELKKGIDGGKTVAASFPVLATPLSAAYQRKCAEIYVKDMFPASADPLCNGEKYGHDKIRLGYFSSDFHDHATAYLMAGLFERHDRSRFEITAFSFGPATHDAMRQRLEKAFDCFIDVSALSDLEIATLARTMEIDIAVDLKGFTKNLRTGIFALRPAPVQVSYLGYPGTMGAPYIDYLLADRTLIPEGHKRYYSEKIVYLPHSYQVNDAARAMSGTSLTRREAGLPDDAFVFCCFNNSHKITPDVFDSWMRLLHAVEGSVLWLLEDNATASGNLRREAAARGIDSARLVFAGRIGIAAHLARHSLADLFVDTFYYNAHTTASDALWAGLPILTCLGETFAGRVAASLLNAVGVPELVARSHAEYEALAIELATHPRKLSACREKLALNRTAFPLFNTALSTRHLEEAYLALYGRHEAGLLPDDIYLQGYS